MHYNNDSSECVSWCGATVSFLSDTNDLMKVTCLECLRAVQQAGETALFCERALLRDIAVFEIKWSALCLMWQAIGLDFYYKDALVQYRKFWHQR